MSNPGDGVFKIVLNSTGGVHHLEYNGVYLPECEIKYVVTLGGRDRLTLNFEGVMVDVVYAEVEGTVVDAEPRMIEAPRNALEQRDEDGIE